MALWTRANRRKYYSHHPENFADHGMQFPIRDASDVRDAVRDHSRAKNPAAVKMRIIAIAKRLDLAHALPPTWRAIQPTTESSIWESLSLAGARLAGSRGDADGPGAAGVPGFGAGRPTAQLQISPRIREIVDTASPDNTQQTLGHEVRVTIIQGGTSVNGYHYDEAALQAIARLVDGAQAYADHAAASTRSVRDIVGFYLDPIYIPPAPGASSGRVDATLHIMESASWLWSLIHEAIALERPELIGLSIDIFGQWRHNTATDTREVTRVVALNSCDIVTRPSAGGSFRRILHHVEQVEQVEQKESTHEGEKSMYHENATGPASDIEEHPGSYRGSPSDRHLDLLAPHTAAASARDTDTSGSASISEQQHQLNRLMHDLQRERCQLTLERRLQESILPQPVRDQLRARFSGRLFEDAELDRELNSALDMMAQLQQQSLVHGHGYARPQISSQITEAEKIQAAFDATFDLDIDTSRLGNIRGFTGIREAYVRVTGDSSLSAGISSNSLLGQIRVHESAPIARISEADLTTASFSYLLGVSMNKRLLKDYQSWPAEWRKFCTIVPTRDFKQQQRIRLGAFGSLPIVPEDTSYQTATLADSSASYVPQKRGSLVVVSRETILNDDLQFVKQMPTRLAATAAYTLAEFVYGFLSANPVIYDGSALFTNGAPHNNLGSSPLSTVAMQNGVTAMRGQGNTAGKHLGLRPRYLVVPPELEFVAIVATQSAGVPGSPNNDINPMLGYVTPIVAPQLSGAQWFMVGDPREIDTIEIGFVGGQVNPALFIQDSPLVGLNFTQDAITYKIRHEYGGAVVDYRGLYRGN